MREGDLCVSIGIPFRLFLLMPCCNRQSHRASTIIIKWEINQYGINYHQIFLGFNLILLHRVLVMECSVCWIQNYYGLVSSLRFGFREFQCHNCLYHMLQGYVFRGRGILICFPLYFCCWLLQMSLLLFNRAYQLHYKYANFADIEIII